MTQEEFIQKTMIALMSNPRVTNSTNYCIPKHHSGIYDAALSLAIAKDYSGEDCMFFDDVAGEPAANFPTCVSERECLHTIAVSLQAIANKKSIKEQQEENDGNIEYHEN